VEAALLMTSAEATESVVKECEQAGIHWLWMYGAGSQKAGTEKAAQFCAEHGMQVVVGECPFMFLPESAGVHRWHGWWQKMWGKYPRRNCEVRESA
jgi:predicted CoA-binding protein